MRGFALVATVMMAAGCGSSTRSTPAGNGAAASGETQAVLYPAGEGVALLACWDPAAGAVVHSDACLTNAPATGAQVLSREGKVLTAGGKQQITYCTFGEDEVQTAPGFAMDTEYEPPVVVWPATAKVAFTPFDMEAEYPATDAQKAAATAALSAALPGLTEVAAIGSGSFDLDGDGKPDTLVAATGIEPGNEPGTSHATIFADFGDGRMVELVSETGTPSGGLNLSSTLDLGGDGRVELVVTGWWNGGSRSSVISVGRDRKVTRIGAIGCDS